MPEKDLSFFTNQNIMNLARKLLKQLPAALKNGQLYPVEHPYFVHSLQIIMDTMQELFNYREEVSFYLVENELYFCGVAMVEDNASQKQFISELEKKNIPGISFLPGLRADELAAMITVIVQDSGELREQELNDKLRSLKVEHIAIGLFSSGQGSRDRKGGDEKAAETAVKTLSGDNISAEKIKGNEAIFYGGIEVIKEIMEEIDTGREISIDKVKTSVNSMIEQVMSDDRYLLGLTTIKNFDEYTYNHSVNVAILSLYLGKFLGLAGEQLALLGEAAMLHDVGKIRVPKEILNKAGELTTEEWKTMVNHCKWGAEILFSSPGVSPLSACVAFEHHLHFDLKGYPPSKGSIRDLNPYSNLVSVCDVYDAATSLRVYHDPVLPTKVISLILEQRGKYFEPMMAKAFVQMMGVYPVGSMVRLDNNEVMMVYANNQANLMRPKVIPFGKKNEELQVIDLTELADDGKSFRHNIKEVLLPQSFKAKPQNAQGA